MTTPAQVLAVAAGQVGVEESPASSNRQPYGAELGINGEPWCAVFVSWVFKHAGRPLPAIDHPWGYSYCPDAVAYAKAHGLWDASGHYAPGDVALFAFDGTGVAEHTGIVESDDGTTLVTIEGNTTPMGRTGSQTNGGAVARKVHPHGPSVLGVLKASALLDHDQEDDMTPPEMLAALDAAAKSTEAGTPVPGTAFIDAQGHRALAMLKADPQWRQLLADVAALKAAK